MDDALLNHTVGCPHCGEPHDLEIDLSAGSQTYIEDCSVCCHPIDITVQVEADRLTGVEVHPAQ